MSGEKKLDRRGFLRRAGAGALGVAVAGSASGAGNARSAKSAYGEESMAGAGEPPQGSDDEPSTVAGQDGGIDRFRMVLPAVEPLDAGSVNVAVVTGDPIRPGERPPPTCFPDAEDQWRAYDAAVVDLTELSWFGGDSDGLGEIARTRTYAAHPTQFGRAYRVVGGTPCDDYVRVTVHDLADEIAVSVTGDAGE